MSLNWIDDITKRTIKPLGSLKSLRIDKRSKNDKFWTEYLQKDAKGNVVKDRISPGGEELLSQIQGRKLHFGKGLILKVKGTTLVSLGSDMHNQDEMEVYRNITSDDMIGAICYKLMTTEHHTSR